MAFSTAGGVLFKAAVAVSTLSRTCSLKRYCFSWPRFLNVGYHKECSLGKCPLAILNVGLLSLSIIYLPVGVHPFSILMGKINGNADLSWHY